MQGRKEEAAALLEGMFEGMFGRSSYAGNWTEYYETLQAEMGFYERSRHDPSCFFTLPR